MRARRLPLLALLLSGLLFLSTARAADVARSDAASAAPRAKNLLIFISDGCGANHVAAAELWNQGALDTAPYAHFPFKAFMSTFSAGGSGYDPEAAAGDFEYLKREPTDSAAAATALSTGHKTKNGALGVDPQGAPLRHLLEAAEAMGKATGVVTTVELSHATPAGFVVHNESRENYRDIAIEMIERSPIDVIMGTGHPLYDDDGAYGYNEDTDGDGKADRHDYRYVGGIETWGRLHSGQAGTAVDADHDGALDDAWTLVETRDAFQALASSPPPKRVIGVPRVYSTLQQARGGAKDAPPFAVPFHQGLPTLAEMVRGALNVLSSDPDGFFLMVEGGAVDWAAHANESGRLIEEETGFNQAVAAALAWLKEKGAAEETLVIVTADHECGYLTRKSSGLEDIPWAWQPLKNKGRETLPDMQWNSGGHTNSLVPLYASGPGATLFERFLVGRDPHWGAYVDNTAVARLGFQAMGP